MKLSRSAAVVVVLLFASVVTAAGITLANHSHTHGDFSHEGEVPVVEHGGGLDQCGGHYNRKTGVYHYHQKKC